MKNAELKIQTDIVKYLRLNGIKVFSVPNGTFIRSPKTRNLMSLSGLTAGVSDLIVLLPKGVCVFLEVKTKIGRQQDTQKAFEKGVKALGFEYHLVRSLDDVIKLFSIE